MVRLIQPAADFGDAGRDPRACGRVGRQIQTMVEGDQRGTQISEMGVEGAGLVPQGGCAGGKQQHVLDGGQRFGDPVGLEQPGFAVVLQPDQDVPVAGDGVMNGFEFGIRAMGCLEQVAQFGGGQRDPVMERVEDGAQSIVFKPDKEMPGKVKAANVPSQSPTAMDVQDAERDGQAFATVDNPYQVCVLQVVIGLPVAGIAEAVMDYGSQRVVFARVPVRQRGVGPGNRFDKGCQMFPLGHQRHAGLFPRGEQQRGFGEVDLRVVGTGDATQGALELDVRHAGCRYRAAGRVWAGLPAGIAMRRGSSFIMT